MTYIAAYHLRSANEIALKLGLGRHEWSYIHNSLQITGALGPRETFVVFSGEMLDPYARQQLDDIRVRLQAFGIAYRVWTLDDFAGSADSGA